FITVRLVELNGFHSTGVFLTQKQICEPFRHKAFADARCALEDQVLFCRPDRMKPFERRLLEEKFRNRVFYAIRFWSLNRLAPNKPGRFWLKRRRIDNSIVGVKHGLQQLIYFVVMWDVACSKIDVSNRPYLVVPNNPPGDAKADLIVEGE